MEITNFVGDILGVPEPTARFLLALFSAYPFAFMYKWMVMKQGAHVQNVFFTVSGMWILYFVYGLHIWHSLLDVVAVYLILAEWGGTMLGVTLTWIVSMGHLVLGYAYIMMSDQVHPISWTIPHCVLVLKLIGLSYNLYDGRKKAETLSEDMKKTALRTMPPFIEVTGFCYFGGSVLAGPQISYVRYQDFVHGRLFDTQTTPSSIPAGLQRMMVGVSFSLLYSVLNQYYPISHLTTLTFANESFLWKLWLVFITGKVALWRYVTVWLIAEGSCIVTGISYGGLKKDGVGEVNWHALANVYLVKNEICITLQGVVESFNINTNQWISMYVFKRLKWLGNKMVSYAVTLTFVALWHGVWPGYYLNFSMEFVFIMFERSFIALFKDVFGYTLSDMQPVFRLPLTLVAYVFKNIMLMYAVTTFMLLSWDQCYKFMSAVYFYAHIVAFFWLLLYYGIIKRIYTPKTKME